MNKRILVLFLLTLLSLLPAVLLYLLFGGLNEAAVTWEGKQVIQLGGPIAAFFIALTLFWRMYKYMYIKDNPLEAKLQKLIGTWEVTSEAAVSKRKAQSETTIAFDDGQLVLGGGTFFNSGPGGNVGEPIGDWIVDIAVSDGRRVKYFYSLTDSIAARTWKGLVEVVYRDDDPPTLQGTWQVIGADHHSGKITMTRK